MILDKQGLAYKDLTIVPAVISDIDHRKECNIFYPDGNLPIFTAPMMTVVNEHNYRIYEENKINVIIPRTVKYSDRINFLYQGKWVALSLKEFKRLFCYLPEEPVQNVFKQEKDKEYKVLIDMADGHMHSLYKTTFEAKRIAKNYGYTLTIMVGNIANPMTYRWICENTYVDYVRLAIGSGANCFVDGTKVKMKDGTEKNIEDIQLGDEIKILSNKSQKVLSTIRYKVNKICNINNEIKCTDNHKFFVINKKDKDIVNEQNLMKYGYWVEANQLNKDLHLLVKSE